MPLIPILLLVIIVILAGVALWVSPGKPQPFLDENGTPLRGSISEKIRMTINGVEQGMFIQGKNTANPVLLYLHGGMPEYFLSRKYPTGLEDHFTVAWWEQRGAGLSYSPDIPRETLTPEQMIADTLEVTDHLRRRFGQEKIYLMGHSGGTFFGIQAAARAPERFHAYVGVSQMANQLESERRAYEYMLEAYKAQGNTGMVRKLEAAPVTLEGGTPHAYLALRDGAMHPLGIGTMRGMKSYIAGIFFASLACRDYTIAEKINTWRGKARAGVSALWKDILSTDLAARLPEIDLPVYFIHGLFDYTCTYAVAKAYFADLKAPLKGFYTFAQSAHSPTFEEPEKLIKILREDVLAGRTSLADIDQQS